MLMLPIALQNSFCAEQNKLSWKTFNSTMNIRLMNSDFTTSSVGFMVQRQKRTLISLKIYQKGEQSDARMSMHNLHEAGRYFWSHIVISGATGLSSAHPRAPAAPYGCVLNNARKP